MLPVLMRSLRLCRPHCLVIAPRGEFSLGALGIKRKRKLLYIKMSRLLGLYNPAIWQASSDFEAEDIRRQFPDLLYGKFVNLAADPTSSWVQTSSSIMTASAIITARDVIGETFQRPSSKRGKNVGELRIVFVGRCSRMKNLSGALKLLVGVPGKITFDLYGPIEDAEYWRECQGVIAALPPNIRVRNNGEIDHKGVWEAFSDHDLFLLPTLGENFGHVIGESLSAGCPVLISDQTPWRNLEAAGVGWDIPLSETERFQSALQQCVDSDSDWISAMSSRAQTYAAKHASDPVAIESNRRLFNLASQNAQHS